MGDSILDISIKTRIEDFSLDITQKIPLSGITGIFGPSGAGKSSLLRIIAGFIRPQQGYIKFGDTFFLDTSKKIDIPAHQRPIGYMFQDARLFPHLTVLKNLEYAHKRSLSGEGRIPLNMVIESFALSTLIDRLPQGLSGGEKQRVALARTILTRPEILLLDEPLSALDKDHKKHIFPHLELISTQFKIPALYVSHDVYEISHLTQMVIKMDNGRINAVGPMPDILNTSTDDTITNQLTVLDAKVNKHRHHIHLTRLETASFDLDIPFDGNLNPGDKLRLFIHARDVIIATERPSHISIRNCLEGKIKRIEIFDTSAFATIIVDIKEQPLKATITKSAVKALSLEPDLTVYLLIKSVTVDHT